MLAPSASLMGQGTPQPAHVPDESWDGAPIKGFVKPGWGPVREEFVENFKRRGEAGAACCVFFQGEKVVDLWGGYRDLELKLPWEEDTIVNVFSTSAGIAGLATAVQISKGRLQLDKPVADFWPKFGANGKAEVTVRQLLAHECGLGPIDRPLTLAILASPVKIFEAIADQKMEWPVPGEKHGYMAHSLGWYQSGLVYHTDPKQRSIGPFLQDEISKPLGLHEDLYVGVPDTVPQSRIAKLIPITIPNLLCNLDKTSSGMVLDQIFEPMSYTARTLNNPKETGDPAHFNLRDSAKLEMPGFNGHASARAIASVYAAAERAINTGGINNKLNLSEEVCRELVNDTGPAFHDEFAQVDTIFSLGFLKPSDMTHFGSDPKAFGTPGAGGSNGFADPNSGIAFAYVMNKMDYFFTDDPREHSLRFRAYECADAALRGAGAAPLELGRVRAAASWTQKYYDQHPDAGIKVPAGGRLPVLLGAGSNQRQRGTSLHGMSEMAGGWPCRCATILPAAQQRCCQATFARENRTSQLFV